MIKNLFQKVLVAYNGSESSLQAVLYGIIMAKQYKCQLKVVYVVDTVSLRQLTLTKFMISEESGHLEESLIQDGARNLSYAVELAKSKGVKIETELLKGAVWSEIIAAADKMKADLILIGGKTTSSSLTNHHDMVSLHNSEIIGSAHCSVMLVRKEQLKELFKLA